MSDVQQIPLSTITGDTTSLADHAGSVLLIVNVASKCGLTPQYEKLEELYEKHHDEGFEVLGFPANNFGAQEPGTDEEIAEFCRTSYSVKFPMFSKISVVGDDQHPLYGHLTAAIPRAEGDPDKMPRGLARAWDDAQRRSGRPLELREVPRLQGRQRGPSIRSFDDPRRPPHRRSHRGGARPLNQPSGPGVRRHSAVSVE